MFRALVCLMMATPSFAAGVLYDLTGQFDPPGQARVSLYGATVPFQAQTESDDGGRFRFRQLRAAAYTVAVYLPDHGEAHQTIEVGPGSADARRRVSVSLHFRDSDFNFKDLARREVAISARELAIPAKARDEYREAGNDLGRHDEAKAVQRLEQAVQLAPQFADAWNMLGTIAYETQQYDRAENCFRKALRQDPKSYEPLVNLGGVLINTHKMDEALVYNQNAVLRRPNDALANSQLGLTYFIVNNFDLALKYLEIARRLDPAHFSNPQLTLAEIHLRRGDNRAAADDLEDFLLHHPDYPAAQKIRETIPSLRQ